MKFKTTHKPLEIFSFSSLTDIVLLLLIFFLLTSQFVIHTGVKVKLPGSKNNEQVTQTRLVVTLTENEQVFVGQDEVSFEALAGKMDELRKTINDDNLIIRADKTVDIDNVIRVIDDAKGIGIEKFTIETEKESF